MGTESESSQILKLQVLENEYKLTLTQYKQAYTDYISSLKNITSTSLSSAANMQKINKISELNDKLTDLNLQIQSLSNFLLPYANNNIQENNDKSKLLNDKYRILVKEKIKINDTMNEYKKLTQEYNDNNIYVEQKYSTFILWVIFAILIIYYIIKLQFFPNVEHNFIRFTFWFVIAVLFFVVTTHLNSAPGFLLWGTIITIVCFKIGRAHV